MDTIDNLIDQARQIAIIKKGENGFISGEVGAVILTKNGKIFKGVSIDAPCGIGFCGEHSAVAAMLTDQESHIDFIIAVDSTGKVLPPCGRCREIIYQTDKRNLNTKIILSASKTMTLEELLPHRWQEEY